MRFSMRVAVMLVATSAGWLQAGISLAGDLNGTGAYAGDTVGTWRSEDLPRTARIEDLL